MQELYLLKKLVSRPLWIGKSVHVAIERQLRALLNGAPQNPEDAVTSLLAQLRRDYAESLAGLYRKNPRKHCGFMEHHYEEKVSAEEWKQSSETAVTCLKNFFEGKIYRRIRAISPGGVLDVERMEKFLIGQADAPGKGVRAWAIPDVVVRGRDGGVVILDWKTSVPEAAGDAGLQLSIYADFACRTYDAGPEQVKAGEVFLRDGSVKWYAMNEERIAKARQTALQSVDRMRQRLSDLESNTAEEDAFPKTDRVETCCTCPFRGPCGRMGDYVP